jgi:hypothetical protein
MPRRRTRFDSVVIVDWSARSTPAPARPYRDAIWLSLHTRGPRPHLTEYCRTAEQAEAMLRELLVTAPGRVLAGFDFSFAYPAWALRRLGGWRALWSRLATAPVHANRFAVAARINEVLGGPYLWGAPRGIHDVPVRKASWTLPQYRACELFLRPRPQSSFKLFTAGSVGSQMLTGIPVLERLRRVFAPRVAVWPFEPWREADIVLAEVYPSLLGKPPAGVIPDEWQVETLAAHYLRRGAWLERELPTCSEEEGWILDLE